MQEVLNNTTLSVIFSSIFYSSFHWTWDAEGIKFGLLTLFGGTVWSILFLASPNVFLLGFSHAILASLFYFMIQEGNTLEKRISFGKKRNIFMKIFN